jgi:hypothetical protein
MAAVAMWVAWVVVFALAQTAGPPQAIDDATVNDDDPVTPITPAARPAARDAPPGPTAPVAPPPAEAGAPSAPAAAVAPPPAEAVEETEPPSPPPAAPPYRPSAGLGFELGYARGGDRFLTVLSGGSATSAEAGDGGFIALSGSWMAYWSKSGHVGIGVYARVGIKYSAVGDGATSVSFARLPLAAGVQLLLPVGGRWYAVGRLGLMTELLQQLAAEMDGVSSGSTDFSPRLGEFIDAGMYWAATEHSGFAALARYERIDVSYAGDVVSANNQAALIAAYFRF